VSAPPGSRPRALLRLALATAIGAAACGHGDGAADSSMTVTAAATCSANAINPRSIGAGPRPGPIGASMNREAVSE